MKIVGAIIKAVVFIIITYWRDMTLSYEIRSKIFFEPFAMLLVAIFSIVNNIPLIFTSLTNVSCETTSMTNCLFI